ncbi:MULTISPECIES: hypothetical protein [unclassified Oceanispirochaeta]|uniref:hypothetical protein n=1 Tax=unclassified Oceanispirochaeta TaxID=2635722 RepID=UPI000E098294|nr:MULTISPECIES: hypothetical protein [unclassified Oceanispirochaeta]MBF9017679.1 hypothetical protein [Oceanispirochaeta sp. M2]NPD74251.1 hypothetical protein [Oceanispirochaeta sp. M1]RDG29957.1 hypothetical protein DV872_19310 [Oceanispirochaeta sp. M1]
MSKENDEPRVSDEIVSDEGRLNNFLTELVNSQDNKLLNTEDVDALLQKYMLTPEDIDKLTMLIDRHLNRALDYKKNERWDSAIVETERALLFSPLDNEVRLDLAELFMKRSFQYGYLQKDLDRAGREASDILTLEPENRAAKKFLKELKQLKQMLRGTQHNRRIIPLIFIVIIILGAALYPQIRKRFNFLSLNNTAMQSSSPLDYVPPWETRELNYEKSSSLKESFKMDLMETTLIRESPSGTPALSIAGYLEAVKDDYSRLELEVFRSDDNSSVGTITVIDEGDAPLRSGETESFHDYMYFNDDIEQLKSVYIGISEQVSYREQENSEWSEEILHNETPLPNGVFLDAESRFISQIEGYDRNYYFYDLRINNKSNTALSTLDFTLQWRDNDGAVKSEQILSLSDHKALPVKAQSLWNNRIMFDLQKDNNKGDMSVLLKEVIKE